MENQKKQNNASQNGAQVSAVNEYLRKKAGEIGILYLESVPDNIEKEIVQLIPEETAKRFKMAAFAKEANVLKVAVVDPQDIEALNILRFVAEKENISVEMFLASEDDVQKIIGHYSSTEKAVEEAIQSLQSEEGERFAFEEKTDEKVGETIQAAPVSKLVQVIIRHAVDGKASDIHIEPSGSEYRVRFRIDGILHSSLVFPKDVGRAVVSRIKILSSLKIDERRKPQDGRFKVVESNHSIDFRVSTLPVVEGEKVVMRVLDKSSNVFDFKSLGLLGRNSEVLLNKIKDTYGIVLITGPTGSGKSTTLYSFLKILNQEERNIITLEDPVEYFVEGINQSQIKPEIGYTFASGLRSILRQDPNVIMVGEIRDSETSELAIHAALTGHLVFSTLHTNDAVGAIPRLVDMGVEPFLLSSSLRVVAAQRLVRKICSECKEEADIPEYVKKRVEEEIKNVSPEEIKKYGLEISKGIKFYQGKGCEACNGVGLKGRVAIYEVVEVTPEMQKIITEENSKETIIRGEALRQGMLTMKQDGLLKVMGGLTTLSEVERVTEGSFTVGGDMDDDKG